MNKIKNNPFLPVEKDPKKLQMRFISGELQGLRQVIAYLWDGQQEAFNIIFFLKSNYKEWPAMITWLKRNDKRGQSLIDMFKNESPDGGGYHMGATYILSRLKGLKHGTTSVKVGELIS